MLESLNEQPWPYIPLDMIIAQKYLKVRSKQNPEFIFEVIMKFLIKK